MYVRQGCNYPWEAFLQRGLHFPGGTNFLGELLSRASLLVRSNRQHGNRCCVCHRHKHKSPVKHDAKSEGKGHQQWTEGSLAVDTITMQRKRGACSTPRLQRNEALPISRHVDKLGTKCSSTILDALYYAVAPSFCVHLCT